MYQPSLPEALIYLAVSVAVLVSVIAIARWSDRRGP